jgi:predicted DNA-binding transcriptional regulator AlpA
VSDRTSSSDRLLLSAEDLASMLSISRATLWRMVSAGKLPLPLRPSPGIVRWRREEITRWVDAGMPSLEDWLAMQGASGGHGNGFARNGRTSVTG